jgi:phosphohistidine phosphatase
VKSLLILRHAKSSWKHPELTDYDRPLNKRGKNDAQQMGKLIRKEKLIPDLIMSSSSTRAYATAKAVAKACDYNEEIILSRSLYDVPDPKAYLKAIRNLDDKHSRVLIVGHNPSIEELLEILTGEIHMMPTCSLAALDLKIDRWSYIEEGYEITKGKLAGIWLPE